MNQKAIRQTEETMNAIFSPQFISLIERYQNKLLTTSNKELKIFTNDLVDFIQLHNIDFESKTLSLVMILSAFVDIEKSNLPELENTK